MKKKKIGLLLLMLLLIFSVAIISGCNRRVTLETPNVRIDQLTQTLVWDIVPWSTGGYLIDINDDFIEWEDNEYDLSVLPPGTYIIRVQALTTDENFFVNSEWSEPLTFIRDDNFGMIFERTDSGMSYEVVSRGSASGDIVIRNTHNGVPITRIAERAFRDATTITSVIIGDNVTEIAEDAFRSAINLTSVTIGNSVVSIGDNAFAFNHRLTNISLPDSLRNIGRHAFFQTRLMTEIDFGMGVENIEEFAFHQSGLTYVNFPDSLRYIGVAAFAGMPEARGPLSNITFGSGLRYIGEDSFRFTRLENLTLHVPSLEIGTSAFAENLMLTSIDLSVARVGEYAFFGSVNLYDITLRETVQSIGLRAFYNTSPWLNNYGLIVVDGWVVGERRVEREREYPLPNYLYPQPIRHLNLPYGIVGVADRAFHNNVNLLSLSLASTVRHIGMLAFAFNRSLSTVTIYGSELETIGIQSFFGTNNLNSISLPSSVRRIGSGAFRNGGIWNAAIANYGTRIEGSFCDLTNTYSYHDGVVYVGGWTLGHIDPEVEHIEVASGTHGIADFAFNGFSYLESISLPEGLLHIGEFAFARNESLEEIHLPNTVLTLGLGAFFSNDAMHSVTLSNRITRIERYTFFRNFELRNITIPNSVTYIGELAFYENVALSSITFGNSVEIINSYAFYHNRSLTTLILPDSLTYIGDHAFRNLLRLDVVRLGNGLRHIGDHAFRENPLMGRSEGFIIPASVNHIGDHAFVRARSIEHIVLPEGITRIGKELFRYADRLQTVVIPESITEIGELAFYGTTNLRNITIPNSVLKIGCQAFRFAVSLESIIIPFNVSQMGSNIFSDIQEIKVYVRAETRPIGWNIEWDYDGHEVVWGYFSDHSVALIFDTRSGDRGISTQTIISGQTATEPENPTRDNWIFMGWYSDVDMTQRFDFEQAITSTTVVFARWEQERIVSTGGNHSFSIDEQGNLWAWGNNYFGQLGDGYFGQLQDGTIVGRSSPIQINSGRLGNAKVISISSSASHSLAIDEFGNIWAWGNNNWGQLGNGTTMRSPIPLQISAGMRFTNVLAGDGNSFALDAQGNLWAWGLNNFGQLGNGTTESSLFPTIVNTAGRINNARVVSVSTGTNHSLAIDEFGNLWAWGSNANGRLGDGTAMGRTSPVRINTAGRINNARIVSISAGNGHSLAIDEFGNLWAWGLNSYGQLGDGTTTSRNSPVQISIEVRGENVKVVSISAGNEHSLAIDEFGNLWAWGLNNYGQLGEGTTTNRLAPVQISIEVSGENVKVVSISAGVGHSLAIDEHGNIWAWGLNNHGQLGDGTRVNKLEPVQILKS
ncbi:MAG: leucine-rich repeat protein [Firmicutes bacterium]|nr:leucine-rich repeat protein [Bacillota bacterium]